MKRLCIIGYGEIFLNKKINLQLTDFFIKCIEEYKVENFLFGIKTAFSGACYLVLSDIKEIHPFIKLVNIKSYEGFDIHNKYFENYYDVEYFPQELKYCFHLLGKKKTFMINVSQVCLFYKSNNIDIKQQEDFEKMYNYAKSKNKKVIVVIKNKENDLTFLY